MSASTGWSCSTLRDGVDVLMNQANQIEEEEESLAKLVKDRTDWLLLPVLYIYI